MAALDMKWFDAAAPLTAGGRAAAEATSGAAGAALAASVGAALPTFALPAVQDVSKGFVCVGQCVARACVPRGGGENEKPMRASRGGCPLPPASPTLPPSPSHHPTARLL